MDRRELVLGLSLFVVLGVVLAGLAQGVRGTRDEVYDMAMADIPRIEISPDAALGSVELIHARIYVDAGRLQNTQDKIKNLKIDIANTDPTSSIGYGNIIISNASSEVNLLVLEEYNTTHYKANIYYSSDEHIWLVSGFVVVGGIKRFLFEVDNLTRGWVTIAISPIGDATIEIFVQSSKPFPEYSDSIIVWAEDASKCEAAKRKYYTPKSTETSIVGIKRLMEKLDGLGGRVYPKMSYRRIVRINSDYYTPVIGVALEIVLGAENITFASKADALTISGGPVKAYIFIPLGLWDSLCNVRRYNILVDGEQWGFVEFFNLWWYEDPWFVFDAVLLSVYVAFLVVDAVIRVRRAWRSRRSQKVDAPSKEVVPNIKEQKRANT